MSTTLFPTPPHALLDDIEHMHYAYTLVIRLLPHPRPPLAFSFYGYLKKLKDDQMEDVGGAERR